MFLYVFTACNPWKEIYEEEMLWYDKARFEEKVGIELVTIKRGAPLGYNPRLVIHRNGMNFDNQAWFLSLGDDFFRYDNYDISRSEFVEKRKKRRIDKKNFVVLEKGSFPQSQRWNGTDFQKVEIPELKQVLEEHISTQERPYEYWTESIVFDALDEEAEESMLESTHHKRPFSRDVTIIAEHDVPMKTVLRATSTTIRSSFGAMFAGWKDGRIQGVLPKPVEAYQTPRPNLWPSSHPLYCSVHLSPTKGWVSCGNARPSRQIKIAQVQIGQAL